MSALAGDNNWMSKNPCDQPDQIEPTDAQFDDAFGAIVEDGGELSDYLDGEFQDASTLFQIYHRSGLPRMDKTENDDNLHSQYTAIFERVMEGFRSVVEDNGHLLAKAQQIATDALQDD